MSAAGGLAGTWPQWRGRMSAFRLTVAVVMHALIAFAPMTYGRLELVLFLIFTYLNLQFGLVLGYHRLLSHRCFDTHRWFRRSLALIGTLAMQSGPITWIALHRVHHRISDQEFDPHTPRHGLGWAHFFWTFFEHPEMSDAEERARCARDLYTDRFIRFCEEKFNWINAAGVAIICLTGAAIGGPSKAFSFLIWLVALRVVALWHITFITNSVAHTFGYRNFNTPDDSRNVPFLAFVSLGDGWHNNHHAHPACAKHGRRWFEIDFTYRLIQLLEKIGVAWNVRHPDRLRYALH